MATPCYYFFKSSFGTFGWWTQYMLAVETANTPTAAKTVANK
jgi:hypothetical protein